MSERAQALEAALRELRADLAVALDHDTPAGTDATWWVSDIMRRIDAVLLSAAAPPVGVSPQPDDDRRYDEMLAWRGLDRETNCICVKCAGAGVRCYSSTATWHGGVGGMTPTMAVCDRCWGSGNESQRWPSHRESPASLSPVEPTPPHKPKSVKVDVTREWCQQAAQAEPDVDITVGVEPTPEPPQDYEAAFDELFGSSPELLSVEPALPTPAPCVWRATSVLPGAKFRAGCVDGDVSVWLSAAYLARRKVCPYCGKRLEVGTAPQGGEQ